MSFRNELELTNAVRAGNSSLVRQILVENRLNPKIENQTKLSALTEAAREGHDSIVKLLLQHRHVKFLLYEVFSNFTSSTSLPTPTFSIMLNTASQFSSVRTVEAGKILLSRPALLQCTFISTMLSLDSSSFFLYLDMNSEQLGDAEDAAPVMALLRVLRGVEGVTMMISWRVAPFRVKRRGKVDIVARCIS